MRLIDVDKLIDDFKNELEKVDFEKLSDNDKLVISTSAIALKDFVKRQPTAYDIDKVVEELEELAKQEDAPKYLGDAEVDLLVGISDVIKIVKSGCTNK